MSKLKKKLKKQEALIKSLQAWLEKNISTIKKLREDDIGYIKVDQKQFALAVTDSQEFRFIEKIMKLDYPDSDYHHIARLAEEKFGLRGEPLLERPEVRKMVKRYR